MWILLVVWLVSISLVWEKDRKDLLHCHKGMLLCSSLLPCFDWERERESERRQKRGRDREREREGAGRRATRGRARERLLRVCCLPGDVMCLNSAYLQGMRVR